MHDASYLTFVDDLNKDSPFCSGGGRVYSRNGMAVYGRACVGRLKQPMDSKGSSSYSRTRLGISLGTVVTWMIHALIKGRACAQWLEADCVL